MVRHASARRGHAIANRCHDLMSCNEVRITQLARSTRTAATRATVDPWYAKYAMRWTVIVILFVSGCWRDARPPVRPAGPATTTASTESPPKDEVPAGETVSYRPLTLTVNAIGVGAMAVGLIGLQTGRNEDRYGALLSAGLITSAFAAPVISLARGNHHNAGMSYLARMMTVSVGSMAGLAVGCSNKEWQFSCAMLGYTWGTAGGLVVANAIDVIYFSEERRTWMPYVTTGGDAGVRAGIVMGF